MKNSWLACAIVMALGQQCVVASEGAAQDFRNDFNALTDSLLQATRGDKRLSQSDKEDFNERRKKFFDGIKKFITDAPGKAGSQKDKVSTLTGLETAMQKVINDLSDATMSKSTLKGKLTTLKSEASNYYQRQKKALAGIILVDANRERRELLRDIANSLIKLIQDVQATLEKK